MKNLIIGAMALVLSTTAFARSVPSGVPHSIVETVNMEQAFSMYQALCETVSDTQFIQLRLYDYSDDLNPIINTESCSGAPLDGSRRVDYFSGVVLFDEQDEVKHVKIRRYNIVRN